ncbi:MAG: hypothetical protein K1X83_09015 [Oligoflexia bacterium]|nr:hypothetical protein [Oligoflexia bacterium]
MIKKLFIFLLILTAFATLNSCSERHEGPLEKAGEAIDNTLDNVKDGDSVFHKKGTFEKAGEGVDDATESNRRR